MNDQCFGVADIRQMTEKLHSFDEPDAGLLSALDAKCQQPPRTAGQIFLLEFVVRTIGQARVLDPGDSRMVLKILCDRHRVVAVPVHSQR